MKDKCCTPIGQVKRHADCNTCHLKPKKLDLSKYTIGIDPYDKEQSALEWLVTELFAYRQPNSIEIQLVKHAQEMEKQQADDFAIGFLEFTEGTYSFGNIMGKWYLHENTSKEYTTKELLEIYKNK